MQVSCILHLQNASKSTEQPEIKQTNLKNLRPHLITQNMELQGKTILIIGLYIVNRIFSKIAFGLVNPKRSNELLLPQNFTL